MLNLVGNTPLIKLNKINPFKGIDIWVKLEYYNPSGSIKDRIVNFILEQAEKKGLLHEKSVIVENTSGNTGAAIAMIASIRGMKSILTLPDKVSPEKQNTLKAYGAKVVICPTKVPVDDPRHYVNQAKSIAAETPDSFMINQYDNPLNPIAHYHSTASEIWRQTDQRITHFIASGSTGGTISGISKYLKEQNNKIFTFMPDPVGSIYYEYFKTGKFDKKNINSYFVEGIGEDHIAKAMNFNLVDEMIQFTDKDAFKTCHQMATHEGILCGGSGGANVWAALQLASKIKAPATLVTIIPDNGIKYLSKIYNPVWIKNNIK